MNDKQFLNLKFNQNNYKRFAFELTFVQELMLKLVQEFILKLVQEFILKLVQELMLELVYNFLSKYWYEISKMIS